MLKSLGDRAIIEVAKEEEETVGGIALAPAAEEKLQAGIAVTIGEGCLLENGEKVPVVVKAGGQVMFERYAGIEVRYEGKEYLIVAGKDTMATVG